MEPSATLAIVWAAILGITILAYVVLDGFDLGVGMLFSVFKQREERDVIMNSVAPVWDGNETWLVLGGGGLMAAFPLAFAIIMPAVYAPVIAMLVGLIFRGVAFEFRWKTERGRVFWERAFMLGSGLAAFAQGVTLGAILQGVEVDGRSYGGGWWDWLTPFTILTGVSVMIGYALLGAGWLLMKTEGDIHDRARRLARVLGILTIACIIAVSLATPFLEQAYWERWFNWPNVLITAQVPLLTAIVAAYFFWALANGKEIAPFLASLGLFVLSFIGLGISIYPFAVPERVTLLEAAAPASSQIFTLIGVAVLIPIILAYTGYAYWVFRGKVRPGEGYH